MALYKVLNQAGPIFYNLCDPRSNRRQQEKSFIANARHLRPFYFRSELELHQSPIGSALISQYDSLYFHMSNTEAQDLMLSPHVVNMTTPPDIAPHIPSSSTVLSFEELMSLPFPELAHIPQDPNFSHIFNPSSLSHPRLPQSPIPPAPHDRLPTLLPLKIRSTSSQTPHSAFDPVLRQPRGGG
jgi:hypothetical protein